MHTKDTWSFGIKSGDSELIVAGGVPIALVIPDDCDAQEFQANCDLIVNAPALLEAAEAVIATWEKGDLAAAVRKLDRALAKAKARRAQ